MDFRFSRRRWTFIDANYRGTVWPLKTRKRKKKKNKKKEEGKEEEEEEVQGATNG